MYAEERQQAIADLVAQRDELVVQRLPQLRLHAGRGVVGHHRARVVEQRALLRPAHHRRVEPALVTRGGPTFAQTSQIASAGRPGAPATDIHSLITAIAGGRIKALLILDTNPLFTLPEAQKLQSALANVPFIASFGSFLDETSVMADVILPSHTTLERWVDDVPEPGVGTSVRTIGQPVVEARWDTRDPGDVLIETARALGGNAAAGLAFENMEAAVKQSFRSVHALAGADAGDFDAFFKKATAAGGWWQSAAPAAAPEPTAQSPRSNRRVNFVMPQQPVAARTFAGDAGQMPFMLHLYPSAAFSDGRTAHLPWLQEMPDPMTTVMWQSWVEINPDTADQLQLDNGHIVAVETGAGALERLRSEQIDCVVLDLRLPDMSGFDVLDQLRAEASLSDIPVVVFTGRELSPEEDAQLHTMARSVVVKGVESPERLLDETALFLHRVVKDLPPEKQRMLERLYSSDEDLLGKTVLLVDDDARNIFALSSVLERRGMKVLTATTGNEAI